MHKEFLYNQKCDRLVHAVINWKLLKSNRPITKNLINFWGRILTSATILDSYRGYSLSMIHPVITLTIGKIAQLRNLIWHQLTPKYPAAAIALAKALAGEVESIDRVASFLEVEMLDEVFAWQVQAIAIEVL
jgi:hypothetical protein